MNEKMLSDIMNRVETGMMLLRPGRVRGATSDCNTMGYLGDNSLLHVDENNRKLFYLKI